MNTAVRNWRSIAHGILEGRMADYPGSRLFGRFIVALIIANGVAVVLESNPEIYSRNLEFFTIFELFSVAVFTVEYVMRLWACSEHPRFANVPAWRARIAYASSPLALVDLLAIAPFYLALFIPIDLRYLRLFRLLRLLKLSHYFDGLQVFASVLRREAGAIAGALLTMLIVIVISACLMFTVENAAQPGHFESIAQAIWWAVVTLTTVGYGDITPVTYAGKLLGMVIMLCGVGTMALPAGILAARFSEELQSRREVMRGRVISALQDGDLDADERRSIRQLQEQLGLSTDDVERIVKLQQQMMSRHKYCPHCGEFIGRDH